MISFRLACRYCMCETFHNSKFKPWDLPFLALGFLPKRCVACGQRMFIHRFARTPKPNLPGA